MSDLELKIRDIQRILLKRGDHTRLIFADVQEIMNRGKYSGGTCPFCGVQDSLNISNAKAVSKCWSPSCKWGDAWHGWYEYAKARGDNLSRYEFYQVLAGEAGVDWPEMSEEAYQKYLAIVRKTKLLEEAFDLCRQELSTSGEPAVKAYFSSRGYDDQMIKEMGLGAYPGQNKIEEALKEKGYSEEEIQQSEFLEEEWETYPALYLWRDGEGRAVGLMGRAIDDKITPRYLYSKRFAKTQILPGLDNVQGAEELILIESPLGAAWLNSQNFSWPAIATGESPLSRSQLEAIAQGGVKRVILALNMDAAGQQATAKMIGQMRAVGLERVLVASWAEENTPVDLALAQGLEVLNGAINSAERSASWQAGYIVFQGQAAGALGEERILSAAMPIYDSLKDDIDRMSFLEGLSTALDMETERVLHRLVQSEEEARKQPQRDAALAGLKKAEKKILAGDLAGYKNILRQNLLAVDEAMLEPPEPYQLADLTEDILTDPESFPLGFVALDPFVSVPRSALSVIVGESGQGKTTFLLNLLARWLTMAQLAEQRFYFYSYEEPRSRIALKLIMIWAGVELHRMQNFKAYLAYFKNQRGTNKAIDDAIERYEEVAGNGSLVIDDSMPCTEELAHILDNIGKRSGVGGVIIDDIQGVSQAGLREAKAQTVAASAQLLRKTAVSADLAIITSSQISDAAEMREIQDIVYEAALVIKLIQEPRNEISISVEKQRTGTAGRVVTINYDRALLRIGYLIK